MSPHPLRRRCRIHRRHHRCARRGQVDAHQRRPAGRPGRRRRRGRAGRRPVVPLRAGPCSVIASGCTPTRRRLRVHPFDRDAWRPRWVVAPNPRSRALSSTRRVSVYPHRDGGGRPGRGRGRRRRRHHGRRGEPRVGRRGAGQQGRPARGRRHRDEQGRPSRGRRGGPRPRAHARPHHPLRSAAAGGGNDRGPAGGGSIGAVGGRRRAPPAPHRHGLARTPARWARCRRKSATSWRRCSASAARPVDETSTTCRPRWRPRCVDPWSAAETLLDKG